MGVYAAKAFGFLLCYWAKKEGHCPNRLMAFKIVEIVALLGAEVLMAFFIFGH